MSGNFGNNGGNLAIITFSTKLNSSVEIADSTIEGGHALKGAGMTVVFGEIQDRHNSCKDIFYRKKYFISTIQTLQTMLEEFMEVLYMVSIRNHC